MTTRIKFRRDTAANWADTNPVLALGEPGLETDTRRVKYGDGVTAWNLLQYSAGNDTSFAADFEDGLNDNVFRFVNVKGAKAFDFETEGNKYLELTLTGLQVADWGNYNLTFTAATVPEMTTIWNEWNNRENNVDVYLKSDFDSNNLYDFLNSITNPSTGVYVFNLASGEYSLSEGDKIVIRYWTEGTTYTGSSWDTYGWFIPDVNEPAASNTVTISLEEFPWMGESTVTDLLNSDYFSKHALYFLQDQKQDNRNVTDVTDNSNGTITITFDGAPYRSMTTVAITFSFLAPDNRENDGYLTVPVTAYDGNLAKDLQNPYDIGSDGNKYSGGTFRSGFVTINGGEPLNFNWYGNDNSESQLLLNMQSNVTYNNGDEIVVTFYKASTQIELGIYRPNSTNWNNGYKWFDWKDDLPAEYHPGQGNGVAGGRGQMHMSVWREAIGTWSASKRSLTHNFGFSTAGNYNDTPRDPYLETNVADWGEQALDMYPMYEFTSRGIVARSTDQYYNGSQSLRYKVRIIYNFDLIIGEDPEDDWFDC